MGTPDGTLRPALGGALALLASLLVNACGAGSEGPRPRNLILISLDTLRPDHLSCYGHPRETTPAIDALAARGVRFADASSAAPWTLPSHATMFTGLYPSHHGVRDYSNRLDGEARTLAEILAERGFQNWAVVSTWNLADPRFEVFQGFAPRNTIYVNETRTDETHAQPILNTGASVVEASRRFLARRDPARPFFLFAHFYDAHTDFTPGEAYREAFVEPYAGTLDGTTTQLMEVRTRGTSLSDVDLRFLRELYDAEIRQLDDVLAGFFAALAEEGLERDTLIVLVSDHGEEFQEHGGLLHGRTQYEELLRVPMILAGPGIPAGRVVAEPVGLVDLLPTVLACFGIEPPAELDGLDLAPTWHGGRLAERVLFGEADHNNLVGGQTTGDIKRSARAGRHKLHWDRSNGGVELYDLASDPGERHDLAPSSPEIVQRLGAALGRLQASAVAGLANGMELTPENLELLRQLGYAGGDEGGSPGDSAPEPRAPR